MGAEAVAMASKNTKDEPELVRRRNATTATKARFADKPFDWRKRATCLHLARFQAKGMGHKLPRLPKFNNALQARRALKAQGVDSVVELLDKYFERITPAAMLEGDLAAFPGDSESAGLESVFVKIASGKFAGWREDAYGLVVLDASLDDVVAAWRL